MAPKHRKGHAPQKSNQEEVEETLQAVVLADTFETRFNPFTLEKPRCLLPLANIPLIEYTLEFLAYAGVGEVFLYPGAHPDQVGEYIRKSKWKDASSPFRKLQFLKSTSTSVGEVMRDLDGKHLITGDFLVVSGDIVSNLPIEDALAKHRARRQADRNAIMTMVLREAGPSHRTKSRGYSPIFVIDPTKDRCLHYEEMHHKQSTHYLSIDPELLSRHPELEVRNDLLDCRIDICTPEVLSLWSDSFDYQAPRKHFLYGVLKDYELNGKTIHTYIVDDYYAARMKNLQAYDAVSKDIISRWTYPICPDTNLYPGHSFTHKRGDIYQENGVALARSCVIKRHTVIGKGTSIGDGTTIENSVIGRRCQIGRNVILDGAYIWDDAVIGDGSHIRQSIVANEAVIGSKCTLEPGVLISFGVRVSEGTKIPAETRITKFKQDSADSDEGYAIVGIDGEGYEFKEDEEDEDDDVESIASSRLMYTMADLALSDSSISTLHSEESDDLVPREGSVTTADDAEDGVERFLLEASNSVLDAIEKNQKWDVVHLELVSLRMAANASEHNVRHAIVTAFMNGIKQLTERSKLGISEAVKQVFSQYKEVVVRSVFDQDQDKKADQVDFLLLVQQDLIHKSKGDIILLFTAKELYDQDILDEEAFHQWWEDERSSADEDMRRVRSQTEQFIDWLTNAEESEESEESEEEEDDESQ